jgi:Rap1a immunity proteins
MKTLLLLALFSATTVCSKAQVPSIIQDGNSLQFFCEDQDSALGQWHRAACSGYIAGVFDSEVLLANSVQPRSKLACFPDGVTAGQTIDVVRKYLKDHPENRHHSAVSITMRAFLEAFPCPSTN